MTAPRIPPRPSDDWDSDVLDALAGLTAPAAQQRRAARQAANGRPAGASPARPASNIVGVFSWHPALTKGFFAFNAHLTRSTLSARVRELLIIRTGWVRQAEYEWAQHVRLGRGAGLTEAEIDAIAEGPDAALWNASDRALLRAVDEICRDRYISDRTWFDLSTNLDRQQLMDVVFTVGAYDLLAMAMNTFGLELDPDLPRFPTPHRRELRPPDETR